jgi:membrane associated rhomboid family serine protease
MLCWAALLLACALGFLGPAQLRPFGRAWSPLDRAELERASTTASGALLLAFGWACLLVYLLWHVLPESFMRRHFVLCATNLEQGRYWTLLSSEISHSDLLHILANMSGLLAVIPGLASSEPCSGIAGLLVACAACSSAASVYGWRAVAGTTRHDDSSSLGASGVVFGLMVVDAIRTPACEVVLYGMTMSSHSALVVQAVAECALGVLSNKDTPWVEVDVTLDGGLSRLRGVDVFAHAGGTLAGLVYCAWCSRSA